MFAQLLVMVGGIFGRAFMQAFAQAKANAAKGGGAEAAAKTVFRRGEMEVTEAYEILNLEAGETDPQKIQEQFDRYFTANDPKTGGSLYLQSKIYRAKERLDGELKKPVEERDAAAGGKA
jgi:import inner membrane translocase subunit TIM16